MWSGDQLLWEIKSAEGPYAADAGGTVSYTHAGGIDRPLAITKSGVGSIIPHQNWRGQLARGTYGAGTGKPLGKSSDCTSYPPVNCVPVPWPGWNTSAWHEDAARPEMTGTEHYWMGSLAVGMRDASGQMYMRNRYYDPQTGQFTQPDPIGLAGGMNVYGFAAGDPVTYADPSGLVICTESRQQQQQIENTYQVTILWGSDGCVRSGSAITARPGSHSLEGFQNDLRRVASARTLFNFVVPNRGWSPRHYQGSRIYNTWSESNHFTVVIDENRPSGYGYEQGGACLYSRSYPFYLKVAHELGHALDVLNGEPENDETSATSYENRYRAVLRGYNPVQFGNLPTRERWRCETDAEM